MQNFRGYYIKNTMNIGVCEKSKMLVIAAGVVILLAMTGCEKKDVYDPDEPDYDNVFDFSTRVNNGCTNLKTNISANIIKKREE